MQTLGLKFAQLSNSVAFYLRIEAFDRDLGAPIEQEFLNIRQFVLPSAAQGRNQIAEIGGGRALSAVSFQRSDSE
jgi:hypothetical protein